MMDEKVRKSPVAISIFPCRKFLWSIVFLSFIMPGGTCPTNCVCKWKGGKETVECMNQNLIFIPDNIDQRTQVLDLSGNKLHILSMDIFARQGLLNLQKIFLNNCGLGEIDPKAFKGLSNLVELDLSNNLLTSIPSSALLHIPALMYLNLNYNNLQRIDSKAFMLLPNLLRLELSGCKITAIANDAFTGLIKLEVLKLNGNMIQHVSQETVMSLERLHGIELQGNPWNCDCHLLPLRAWLFEYKIPHPMPPVCSTPKRVAGRSLDKLPVTSFACPPQIQPMSSYVEGFLGENTTISCRVRSIPAANITWYYEGSWIRNGTGNRGKGLWILERGQEEKHSSLVILDPDDRAAGNYKCQAANSAGIDEMNFTLGLAARSILSAGLTYDQVAGIILGLIVLIIVILAIIVILLIKIRQSNQLEKDERSKPHHDVIGNGKVGSSMMDVHSGVLNGGASFGFHSTASYDVASSCNGSIMTAQTGGYHIPHNPDLISGVDVDTFVSPAHQTVSQGVRANSTYANLQSDSLYPSGVWDHVVVAPRPIGSSEESGDINNQFANSSYGDASYDSYEPLKYSTPKAWAPCLAGAKLEAPKPPPPPPPVRYGYPPDYGLPIAAVLVTPPEVPPPPPPPLPPPLDAVAPPPATYSPAHTSSSSSSPPSLGGSSKTRVKNQGVCVLPPLPSVLKAKLEDSPDEGYQEDGTEV